MTVTAELNLAGPIVNLSWITRQAEGQVGQLCSVDQAKVAEVLARPLPRNRCELVDNLAKYRVYHFRASKTLRISYRPTEQGLCVIHVGKHSEFDRFARHFAGQTSSNLIPLEESMVMKNYQQAEKNGATKTVIAQANSLASPQAADQDEQLLVESLREVIGKAIGSRQTALASEWGVRLDKTRQDLEQTAEECGRKIAQQEARLHGLTQDYHSKLADVSRTAAEIDNRQAELAASVAQGRADLEARQEAQGHCLEEIREEVKRQAVQASVASQEIEQQVMALSNRVEDQTRELGVRLDSLAGNLESQAASHQANVARWDGQVSGVEQRLGSVDQVLQGLVATVQAQRETISRLEESLSRLSIQVVELMAPRSKQSSWQRISGWARALPSRFARSTFRKRRQPA